MKRCPLILALVLSLLVTVPTVLVAVPFQIWVTVSPPGPENNDPDTWGGIIRYGFDDTGGPATSLPGIDRSLVYDPCGLVYRAASHELLVGNRHGNTGGGSISRFVYDADADTFLANGTISGNGLYGVHQLAINPVTGELFATNYGGGISRFLFDENGDAIPNGRLGGSTWTRGVAVSPDGTKLYVTSAGSSLRIIDIETGDELPSVSVAGAVSLHFVRLGPNRALYVADPVTSRIYWFTLDENGIPGNQIDIYAPSAVGEALSPDYSEMFSTGHLSSHQVTRFQWDGDAQSWVITDAIYPEVPLGDILVHTSADVVAVRGPVPPAPRLLPNRPNPFNPATVIPFRLDATAVVNLAVFDAAGRRIRELAAGTFGPGVHAVTWHGLDDDGRTVPTGMYLVRLRAGNAVRTRGMMLVR